MPDFWFIVLLAVICAGLPLYIYAITRLLMYGYIWYISTMRESASPRNRDEIVESPIDWYFLQLTMKYGHPDWSRPELVIPWTIMRSLIGALIGLVIAFAWLLLT